MLLCAVHNVWIIYFITPIIYLETRPVKETLALNMLYISPYFIEHFQFNVIQNNHKILVLYPISQQLYWPLSNKNQQKFVENQMRTL